MLEEVCIWYMLQAAFECMYTLLDSCLDRIDIFEFLKHVEDGLNDHYDIKMLTYLMLVRLAHLCPSAVLQREFYFQWLNILLFAVLLPLHISTSEGRDYNVDVVC